MLVQDLIEEIIVCFYINGKGCHEMLDRVKECEDYDPDDPTSGLLSLDYGGSIISMCLLSRAMDAKEKAEFILEFHKFCR